MNKEKEIEEMAEQMFQQGYIDGKRADIVAGVYDILTRERNIAGNPALAIRICDYVADEVRKETAKEIKDLVNSFLQKVIFDEEIPNELSNRLVWHFEKLKKHIEKRYVVEVDE